jgi:Leucine-rich repeat (LRR) protein
MFLSNNQLSSLNCLRNLKFLKELDISHNRNIRKVDFALMGLETIKMLNASSCNIESLQGLGSIANTIENLNLRDNNLSTIDFSGLDFKYLMAINLMDNRNISKLLGLDKDIQNYAKMPHLLNFDLTKNMLK